MRKLLLGLITIVLLGLSVYMVIYGITLFKTEINSVPGIQEEDEILETKIQTASRLRNTTYPETISTLNESYKKLTTEKENYEQLLALGVDEDGQPLNKIQEYEIEKIWVTLGNYAKKEGVVIKMDVTVNNTVNDTYDLKFTVEGGYIQITDFLYDIEKDKTLVFKLENFKLVAGTTTDVLVGTFTCRAVKLNIKDVTTTTDQNTTTDNSTSNSSSSSSSQSQNSTSTNTNTDTNTDTSQNSSTSSNSSTNKTDAPKDSNELIDSLVNQ